MRPSGRNHDSMREVRIELDYTKHADGSVQISRRRHPGVVHLHGRRQGPAISQPHEPGVGHRRVRHASRRDQHPLGARSRTRQANRPDDRDPAPDRPLAALRCESLAFGHAHASDRLRCDPGRRGHTNRIHHRRISGPGDGIDQADGSRSCFLSPHCRIMSRPSASASSMAPHAWISITGKIPEPKWI